MLYDILTFIKDNGGTVCGILIILSMIIDVSPIKINPWKQIGKQLKEFFTGELKEEITSLKAEIKEVDAKLDKHIQENNEETARKWRHDILEFCNQELNHKRHTKEQWDDVLPSCAEYERFCERNNIINEKATKAIKELNRRYEMHMANEDFLEENEI
jgi:hypothetical protein